MGSLGDMISALVGEGPATFQQRWDQIPSPFDNSWMPDRSRGPMAEWANKYGFMPENYVPLDTPIPGSTRFDDGPTVDQKYRDAIQYARGKPDPKMVIINPDINPNLKTKDYMDAPDIFGQYWNDFQSFHPDMVKALAANI